MPSPLPSIRTFSPPAPACIGDRLRRIQHVALDMDGTIYCGDTLFNFTNPFLALLSRLDIGYTLLTNNSSKSVEDYIVHLRKLGIHVTRDQLYTSTQATIEFLQEEMPLARRVFLLGTESMGREIAAAGFTLCADHAGDEPDAVLVGFDTGLTYSRLCRAAYWIKRGKPFIASHVDRVCPTDEPTVLVDCGAVCAALKAATGRGPDAVLGKPDPRMLRDLLQRHELRPENLAMVGDRLYTDMAMAERASALGILVLTGEATAQEAAQHMPPLDLIVPDIARLGELLMAARNGERE
ncbi:MAG: HAD-IIA family hydrolase [Pedosphaera sp.]|nr:HAD-IIA family hydrolase [Pedosphaera sp.]